VAGLFFSHSFLPVWGPFGIGKHAAVIGPIKGKTFLEVGFGSGHSINYLVQKGARKVYGVDISKTKLDFAAELNKVPITKGKVELFEKPMEKRLKLEPIDTVFSIYGFGWTIDPKKTLANIYSYLKPGGQFIWSWDNSVFSVIHEEAGKLVVSGSYHEEREFIAKKWKGVPVYLKYRKTATWFRLLRDAGFMVDDYMEPAPIMKKDLTATYYTIRKAERIPCSAIWICIKPK